MRRHLKLALAVVVAASAAVTAWFALRPHAPATLPPVFDLSLGPGRSDGVGLFLANGGSPLWARDVKVTVAGKPYNTGPYQTAYREDICASIGVGFQTQTWGVGAGGSSMAAGAVKRLFVIPYQ